MVDGNAYGGLWGDQESSWGHAKLEVHFSYPSGDGWCGGYLKLESE